MHLYFNKFQIAVQTQNRVYADHEEASGKDQIYQMCFAKIDAATFS